MTIGAIPAGPGNLALRHCWSIPGPEFALLRAASCSSTVKTQIAREWLSEITPLMDRVERSRCHFPDLCQALRQNAAASQRNYETTRRLAAELAAIAIDSQGTT
jgi:hypothetical protein